MFKPVYFITVVTATLGASTQFYSYGIVNPEQELLTAWINNTFYTRSGVGMDTAQLNFFWSFIVSSIAVGAIFGALLTRTLAERFGRRNALIANGVVNVFAALLEFFAKPAASPEFLIVGRLLLGANMGLSSGIVPMYLLEITPTKYRGTAGTFHQVAVAFSDWFSLLLGLPEFLGSDALWPWAFSFPGIPALFLCIILPFCPESPKYTLITRGNRQAALDDLERLVEEDEAQKMFDSLVMETTLMQDGVGTYRELFGRREFRIPLLIAVLVMIAQQFTGCSAVFAFSTDMFLNARLAPTTARFSTLTVGITYFFFACSASLLIESVGRRALSIFQLGFCTIALSLLSFLTWLQESSGSEWASYATIGALIFYMCVYGLGSPIPWMITSEIFPTKFRSAAVTVAVFVAYFFSFLISTLYLPFQQLVGVAGSYLPFIIVSACTTVAIYILLPETRGKQPSDIVDEIRHRAQSVSVAHPMRIVHMTAEEETTALLHRQQRPRSDSMQSYHQYMSIAA